MTTVNPDSTVKLALVWAAEPGTPVPQDPRTALPVAFGYLGCATFETVDWGAPFRFEAIPVGEHATAAWRQRADGKRWTVVLDWMDGDQHWRAWKFDRLIRIDGDEMTVVAE